MVFKMRLETHSPSCQGLGNGVGESMQTATKRESYAKRSCTGLHVWLWEWGSLVQRLHGPCTTAIAMEAIWNAGISR